MNDAKLAESQTFVKAKKGKKKPSLIIVNIVTVVILVLFAFAQVFPFYLQLVYSFQPFSYIAKPGRIDIWPILFQFSNYPEAFRLAHFGEGFLNTIITAVSFTALSLVVVLICGYVLGKKNFYGKKIIFLMLIATMMIPGEVLMVPNYLLMIKMKMLDTLLALIIPGIVNIFGIFLVKQYMNTIPDSILESAEIDGASEIGKIVKIILPLCGPVVATYCILTFTATWNDYLWPMVVLRSTENFTLQLKLKVFSPMFGTSRDQILMAAGLMIALIPVVTMYCIFQKKFIESASISGLK